MENIKNEIKKFILVKYAENNLNKCNTKLAKSLSWIQRKSLINTITMHCKVILNALINQNGNISLRKNTFLIDSIIKYTLGRSENIIKSNRKAKDIKSFMQLNSYIVYDEIVKGYTFGKNKKTIGFNIDKKLSELQEKIDSKTNIEDLLKETINA